MTQSIVSRLKELEGQYRDLVDEIDELSAVIRLTPDASGIYVCDKCKQVFSVPVWHCECDHHWPVEDTGPCHNCHEFFLADDGTVSYLWP